MSVITTADEIKADIPRIVNYAVQILKDVENKLEIMTDEETWGGNEWSKEFKSEVGDDMYYIHKVTRKLSKLKDKY